MVRLAIVSQPFDDHPAVVVWARYAIQTTSAALICWEHRMTLWLRQMLLSASLALILIAAAASGEPTDQPRWTTTGKLAAAEAHQAAAADEQFIYAITNKQVAKYDRETKKRVAVSTGEAKHLNSGFFWTGKLYCAHSNYPLLPEQSEIKVLDPRTMKLMTFKDFGNFGGSLTWAVLRDDHWWCNFARYGQENDQTFLVKFDDQWREQGRWTYPQEVIRELGRNSLSGGLWLNGELLVTGHDDPVLFRLVLTEKGDELKLLGTQAIPFTGQGFAHDPKSGGLVGIDRAKRQIVLAEEVSEEAADLAPPKVEAMLLVGQAGSARSEVSRNVLLAGDYLYVSGEPGLQTISVAKPGELKLTDDWTKTSAKVNGTAIKGTTLYVANWSPGAGLLVFDLADPAKPRLVRTIKTAVHTWTADVHGDLLYVAIDDGVTTGINTYDVREPADPKLIHFLEVGDRLVNNVARSGRHMYFTHKKILYVYDAQDPAAPRKVGEVAFQGLAGKSQVRGDYLYVLSRAILPGEEGGLTVYSLIDPENPRKVAHWPQKEPRDFCFVRDRIVVPCSGSGIYTLDASWPSKLREIAHWYLAWPNSGKHAGYPVTVGGSGDYVYLGTTGGNNPECEDFDCPYRGGRVYAVRLFK